MNAYCFSSHFSHLEVCTQKNSHTVKRYNIAREKSVDLKLFFEQSLIDAWSKATLNQISTQIIPTTLKPFYAASHRILRKKMQYPLLQTVGLSLSTVKQKIFPSQKSATKYILKKALYTCMS